MAYSEKRIAETLAVLKANGGNVSRTSRETGVPRGTLRGWRDASAADAGRQAAIADQTEEQKERLGDVLEGFIRRVFSVGITDEKLKAADVKDLVLAAAVAVDKMQLLRGEPTDINEQRGLTVLQQFNQQINNGDGADQNKCPQISS